jgi:hypothetical protein
VQKIEMLSDDDLRALISEQAIVQHRLRAMSPDAPVLRGTAQNPDAFFQGREACNPFYTACPDIVQQVMEEFAEQVVKELGELAGKIIIDPTNRVARQPDGWSNYDQPANAASNAELIQAAAPRARVVKAFNTLNVAQMVNPETSGGPLTIAIAGDDEQAKATVVALIKGMGLEPMDFGPLRFAHMLEEMLIVWANGRAHGTPFNYYLRPQPPAPAAR